MHYDHLCVREGKRLKVLVLGCGQIGSVIASDFAKSIDAAEVVVADKSPERARSVASSIEGTAWIALDGADYGGILSAFEGFDLVISARSLK